ncbi:MAG: hypothetical protein K0U98_24480 [Deltaproteobacteria bacterium]|nr:hypothetical protein [Deltaproteobacteria bacterium]
MRTAYWLLRDGSLRYWLLRYWLLTLLLLPIAVSAQGVEIRVEPDLLQVGEEVGIELEGADEEGPGVSLWVHHLPGSQLARASKVDPGASPGRFDWQPARAGLVRLEAQSQDGEVLAQRDLAVRFNGLPYLALGVLLAAGGLLLAGAWTGFRGLFQSS